MKRLAIITTHPIQYHAPVFRLLTERGRVAVKVFFTKRQEEVRFDPGFRREVVWDIPLLEGYAHEFAHPVHHLGQDGLIKSLRAWQPEAILIFGWNFRGHFNVMRFFKGKVPIFFRGDSHLLDERPGWRRTVRRWVLRIVYRYVDYALYVGRNNRDYYRAHGLRDEQLIFAPHAIDNERFADGPAKNYRGQARRWREELGFGQEDIVVLFAGKFEFKKAPDLLLKAVQSINENREHPIKVLFVGDGPMEKDLKGSAEDDPNIRFVPFQNQSRMPVVYRLGDVFCLPSRGPGETWGLAVNEAMACKRPVLTSNNIGCAIDLVSPFKTGLVFQSNDLDDFSDKISLMADRNQLIDWGENAFQSIKKWSIENQLSAIESVINQAI